MDDLVRQAMAKWPNVPACYGWLGLDSRGQWHMRDDRVQALGPFQSGVGGAKGSVLRHEKLIDFIRRNYQADAKGRWYFQNGPQQVYVELETTPLIWRVSDNGAVTAHTGQGAQVLDCLVDEDGRLYLHTTLGFGLVHTLDVVVAADLIESGQWTLGECRREELPRRFGYVTSPEQCR
ncbi:MAG: DUF2946 family protein [Limnohabitans sp.]